VIFLIVVYFKATCFDLGLPANLRELTHDVFVGLVAGLAALAPVLIIQGQLLRALQMPETESHNPLIKALVSGGPSFGVLLLASVATVVIAPVCEELTFRLLLQGWLEKWEARRLGLGARDLSQPSSALLCSHPHELICVRTWACDTRSTPSDRLFRQLIRLDPQIDADIARSERGRGQ